MSDENTNKRTLALVASLLAMGMVAASIAGGHMLSAQAQISTDPKPVGLGCPTGAEVCEQQINDTVQSVVSTSGTATVKVTPDKVSVNIGVETPGSTAEEAAAENSRIMEKVLKALRDLGIDEDKISTSSYNVWPLYEWRSPPCIEIYPQPPGCSPKNEITGLFRIA